ncbi:hypothetical protein KAS50_07770 [bacterium]|nr:hypothetical protein [bacterium]
MSAKVSNRHICCNRTKENLRNLRCDKPNCEKCSHDVDENHHPNNGDCPDYKPIEVFVIDVKPLGN